jgi:hypothetical protein
VTVAGNAVGGVIERFLGRLRFPHLFWLTALLFLLDVLIPDLVPFADEVLLGLATLLLGSWKKRRGGAAAAPSDDSDRVIDVTPEE